MSMPLVSLMMASNRPKNLAGFFESLERMTANPANVEVLIKIDEEDAESLKFLESVQGRYPYRIDFIRTPRNGGYFDLWRAYNDLLKIAHPQSQFLAVFTDELRFLNQDWDLVVAKHADFFADKICRLRISKHRLMNYFDVWQCGYAPDAFALHSRRWIELGGDWTTVGTPDVFQECIAYYLAKSNHPNRNQINRDIPVMEIKLDGEQPYRDISPSEFQFRRRRGWKIWYQSMSYKTQLECSRRAHVLRAHIEHGLDIDLKINTNAKTITALKKDSGEILAIYRYKISRLATWIRNWSRYPLKEYHCGGSWSDAWANYRFLYVQPITDFLDRRWSPIRLRLRRIPFLLSLYRRLKGSH